MLLACGGGCAASLQCDVRITGGSAPSIPDGTGSSDQAGTSILWLLVVIRIADPSGVTMDPVSPSGVGLLLEIQSALVP